MKTQLQSLARLKYILVKGNMVEVLQSAGTYGIQLYNVQEGIEGVMADTWASEKQLEKWLNDTSCPGVLLHWAYKKPLG